MTIRIVIADDHPLILDALSTLFASEVDLRIVQRCSSGEAAIAAVREHHPDVLLLDVRMPHTSGMDVMRALVAAKSTTRVVLLTAQLDDEEVLEAVRLGARGLVLKDMASRQLLDCIRSVHAGGLWLEKASVGHALESLLRREEARREIGQILTNREIEIVRMTAEGFRNRDIGEKLFISEGTVKVHLHNIYEKLDVSGRVELTRYAQKHRIV